MLSGVPELCGGLEYVAGVGVAAAAGVTALGTWLSNVAVGMLVSSGQVEQNEPCEYAGGG